MFLTIFQLLFGICCVQVWWGFCLLGFQTMINSMRGTKSSGNFILCNCILNLSLLFQIQSSEEPPGPDWLCSCLREPPRRRSLYSPPGSCPHNVSNPLSHPHINNPTQTLYPGTRPLKKNQHCSYPPHTCTVQKNVWYDLCFIILVINLFLEQWIMNVRFFVRVVSLRKVNVFLLSCRFFRTLWCVNNFWKEEMKINKWICFVDLNCFYFFYPLREKIVLIIFLNKFLYPNVLCNYQVLHFTFSKSVF